MQHLINIATQSMVTKIALVAVVFSRGDNRSYTYKAGAGIFKPGDLAIVATKDGKYKTVQVKTVEENPILKDTSYPLSWIICKVTNQFVELQKEEAAKVKELTKLPTEK